MTSCSSCCWLLLSISFRFSPLLLLPLHTSVDREEAVVAHVSVLSSCNSLFIALFRLYLLLMFITQNISQLLFHLNIAYELTAHRHMQECACSSSPLCVRDHSFTCLCHRCDVCTRAHVRCYLCLTISSIESSLIFFFSRCTCWLIVHLQCFPTSSVAHSTHQLHNDCHSSL
jgi:hypothetical protein